MVSQTLVINQEILERSDVADNLREYVEISDAALAAAEQPSLDGPIIENTLPPSGYELLDGVMAQQAESRKHRPIIVAIGILGVTGTVVVIKGIKRGRPDGPR